MNSKTDLHPAEGVLVVIAAHARPDQLTDLEHLLHPEHPIAVIAAKGATSLRDALCAKGLRADAMEADPLDAREVAYALDRIQDWYGQVATLLVLADSGLDPQRVAEALGDRIQASLLSLHNHHLQPLQQLPTCTHRCDAETTLLLLDADTHAELRQKAARLVELLPTLKYPLSTVGCALFHQLGDGVFGLALQADDATAATSQLEAFARDRPSSVRVEQRLQGSLDFFKGHTGQAHFENLRRVHPDGLIQSWFAGISLNPEWLYPGSAPELLPSIDLREGPETLVVDLERTGYPLSQGQLGMWFFNRLDPESTAYLTPFAFRLRRLPDMTRVRQAFERLIERHPMLRTRFVQPQGQAPIQVTMEQGRLDFDVEDCRHLDDAQLDHRLREWCRTPFNLDRDPLLRVRLLHRSDQDGYLAITLHHIIFDGVSMNVFMKELAQFYHQPDFKPQPLETTYQDFVAWQQEYLESHHAERALSFWRRHLEGELPPLDLPAETNAGPRKPGIHVAELRPDLHHKIRTQARKLRANPFILGLAGYFVFLARLTRQRDLIVGVPYTGRSSERFNQVLGYFVNLLPVRLQLGASPSFAQVVQDLRGPLMEAIGHGDYPFQSLVQALELPVNDHRNPIAHTIFAWQGQVTVLEHGEKDIAAQLGFEPVVDIHQDGDLDFALEIITQSDRVLMLVNYDSARFSAERVTRMTDQYQTLLSTLCENPEQSIFAADWLAPEEAELVMRRWPHVPPLNDATTIHQRIEAMTAANPNAVAIVCQGPDVPESQSWTYDQLNREANRMARVLRRHGVGYETPVAVAMGRSPELIAGMLAILKAGGCYVPLVADYPAERIAFMVEHSEAALLLSDHRTQLDLEGFTGQVLRWEDMAEARAAMVDDNLDLVTDPDQRHNILYTSGTTGKPKGVVNTHRGVIRLFLPSPWYQLRPDDVTFGFASPAFDVASYDFWAALLNGATTALFASDQASVGEIAEFWRRFEVTHSCLPTGLFHQIADGRPQAYRGQRETIAIGDKMAPTSVARILEAAPDLHIVNGYGPTENSVLTTAHTVKAGDPIATQISIGTPLANSTVYIVDDALQLTPINVPGELVTGGSVLARCYHKRPDLTALRFTPDPFATEPGARLYHCGDLARWEEDGQLAFMGRLDFQIKIRGFRIEPDEIQGWLLTDPEVEVAYVSAWEDRDRNDKRLVAYVVAPPSAELEQRLRELLQEHMPPYMEPNDFVFMERLPLNNNGKIDRKALPAPKRQRDDAITLIKPRTQTEKRLAVIWSELLRVDEIGVYDAFFKLGGHSLLATRVLSRVQGEFQKDVPIRAFFQEPTIAALARLIDGADEAHQQSLEPTPRHVIDEHHTWAPLAPAQLRLYLIDRLDPGLPAYNLPGVLRIRGPFASQHLETVLERLASRHEALRTSIRERDGQAVQIIHDQLTIPLARIAGEQTKSWDNVDQELDKLAVAEAQRPFDLSQGPLCRCTLIELAPDNHVFMLTMHHVISDGWSIGIFAREFVAIYEALIEDREPELPILPIQYADFAAHRAEADQNADLERQIQYWVEQLGPKPARFELTPDKVRPNKLTFTGSVLPFHLSPQQGEGLRALADRHDATPFMVLFTAFLALLHRYTGKTDIPVGAPIANRNHADLEGIIGFFANTLVLRGDLSDAPTGEELLGRVRDITLDAYAHQDAPFEKLVERLQPDRDLSRTPLFQVMFILQDTPAPAMQAGDCTLTEIRTDRGLAPFDLTLNIEPQGDGYIAAFEYKTDLFERETIARLAIHFTALLDSLLDGPNQRISALAMLTHQETRQLLHEWDRNPMTFPETPLVPKLVTDQANRQPEAAALRHDDRVLSYDALDARAEILAGVLAALGVTADTPVACFAPRGFAQIVAHLAVLKAGGAVTPLSQVDDTALTLVEMCITTTETFAQIAPSASAAKTRVLRLSADGELKLTPDLPEPIHKRPHLMPDNLAAMMFVPDAHTDAKGVMITHRGLANAARAAITHRPPVDDEVAIGDQEHAWLDVWPALCAGACVDLSKLAAIVEDYGPAETTFTTTWDGDASAQPTMLGHLAANALLYVIGPNLTIAPVGAPGELLLGGAGLARGYWGRPAATAEAFVPHPFSEEPGARLHRSGDVGRHLADGSRQHLGRLDRRIRHQGRRFEPEPVERLIRQLPGIRDACIVQEQRDALMLFLVSEPGRNTERLKQRVIETVDHRFNTILFLEQLPQTAQGKPDVEALLRAREQRLEAPDHAEPRTVLERQLVEIFAEALHIDGLSIHDSFFELGGHSLLAARVMAGVRTQLQRELPMRVLFEHPTVAQFAKLLDGGETTKQDIAIRRADRNAPIPLSDAQDRLRYIHWLDPDSPAYNVSVAFLIRGAFNLSLFHKTIDFLIQRHEGLRTRFIEREGQPVQDILDSCKANVRYVDLRDTDDEQAIQDLVTGETSTPFDLAQAPLMRVLLIRSAEEAHQLVITQHHIITDAWSVGIFLGELAVVYDAFNRNQAPDLPPLPLQYADYAVWRHALERSGQIDEQLEFWRKTMAHPPTLDLATDYPRPPLQTFNGAVVSFAIEHSQSFKKLAQKHQATSFMALLAAFAVLLGRYTRQDDLVIGVASANRGARELDHCIGFFLNLLPVRINLGANPSFVDLLDRVRQVSLGAFANQDVPFQALVDELQPQRNPAIPPLFQAMFIMQEDMGPDFALAGLDIEPISPDQTAAKLDLTLTVAERAGVFHGSLEYNTDLFARASIERFSDQLQTLIANLLDAVDEPLAKVSMLPAEEKQHLIHHMNQTQATLPEPATLTAVLGEALEAGGERLALIYEDDQWTYDQLRTRASQIAHRLRECHVDIDAPVAVYLERTPDLLAALLGVLLAGGAYVPVDPIYPAQRIQWMFEDAQPVAVLTDRQLAETLPETTAHCILLDEETSLNHLPVTPPVVHVPDHALAYTIFTSGSTGRPKGVQLPHRTVVNFLRSMKHTPGLEVDDRLLAVTTVCFDIAVLELYLPLTVGAAVVLADRDQSADGWLLRELIDRHQVTVMQATPATWRLLGYADYRGSLKALCGGEALPPDLATNLLMRGMELWNVYGPTETTVWSTLTQIDATATGGGVNLGKAMPIGKPIDNTSVYLTGPNGKLSPQGAPGELLIGGEGVARGYLLKPSLTAEKFVPDPFGPTPGARLYRTGDLARHLPDGRLEYMGRTDFQVKLRGYRIELGEIDAALNQHPNVRQAVSLVKNVNSRDTLVAYLVVDGDGPTVWRALRDGISERLPNYMVPTLTVFLDAMPLTENGKINRRALPEPSQQRIDTEYVAPRTAAETALVEIWQDLLKRDPIGVTTSFFDLGGDSLLIVRMVAAAADRDIVLTPKQVLSNPTIEALAASLDTQSKPTPAVATMTATQSESGDDSGPTPLSPHQQWYFQTFPREHIWIFRELLALPADIDPDHLRAGLAFILRHHDGLRLRTHEEDGVLTQHIEAFDPDNLPLYEFDLRDVPDADREAQFQAIYAEVLAKVDHFAGPQINLGVIHMPQQTRLIMNLHHSVSDFYTINFLVGDFFGAYATAKAGKEAPAKPSGTSYGDWAQRMNRFLAGPNGLNERAYWMDRRRMLAHPVPTDFDCRIHRVGDLRFMNKSLEGEAMETLLRLTNGSTGLGVDDLLLVALARAYTKWTEQAYLRLDIEHHGRSTVLGDVDLSHTAGSLTTKYPLTFDTPTELSILDVFQRVLAERRVVPSDGIGFGLLRYCASAETVAAMQQVAAPDIFFNYKGQVRETPPNPYVLGKIPAPHADNSDDIVSYLIIVEGVIDKGILHMDFLYSRAIHKETSLSRFGDLFIEALTELLTALPESDWI